MVFQIENLLWKFDLAFFDSSVTHLFTKCNCFCQKSCLFCTLYMETWQPKLPLHRRVKKTVVGENKANSRDSFWLFCQFTVATATSRRFVARFSANKTIKKAQHRVECFAQCTKTNLFWIYIPTGWKCYARHRKASWRTFIVCKKHLGLAIIKQIWSGVPSFSGSLIVLQ